MRTLRHIAAMACGVAATFLIQSCDSSKSTAPKPVVLTSISAGMWHACGLTATGAAYCWGNNSWGSVGDGTHGNERERMTAVQGATTFTQISSGSSVFSSTSYETTCAVKTTGGALCWGENSDGAVGDGTLTDKYSPAPVAGSAVFTKVFAGYTQGCGLTVAGAAWCWGRNTYSQLGDGTTITQSAPVAVAGGLTFQTLGLGDSYACGITTGNAAYCWGYNGQGTLGDGTFNDRTVPTAVLGGLSFKAISGGASMTCGLSTAGAAYCWGNDSLGATHKSPRAIAGGHTFESITVGAKHACALTAAGAAWCWGGNDYGQLGTGATSGIMVTPVAVSGSLVFTQVSAGAYFTCGITATAAYCWGANSDSNLGDGTTTHRYAPVQVLTP